jgi:hypothetical protein
VFVEKSTKELLYLYNDVLQELERRRIVKGASNPVSDLARCLAKNALKVELVRKSTRGYDAVDSRGCRYEIKGRRLTKGNPSPQLSELTGLEKGGFTHLVAVLFTEDFEIQQACVVPIGIVREEARLDRGRWRLAITDAVLQHAEVVDVTQSVREALNAI